MSSSAEQKIQREEMVNVARSLRKQGVPDVEVEDLRGGDPVLMAPLLDPEKSEQIVSQEVR